MVLIISTFKVANDMVAAVRQAFLERPGIVDAAPGFLGMEVAVDRQDSSIFHLLTRWTDEASFQAWHSGPTHKLAHRGIPKGLKLDASHTVIRKLDVLLPERTPIANLPQFLARSRSVHWLKAAFDGGMIAVNPAFELLFQEPGGALAGKSLWDYLTQEDAGSIQAIVQSPNPDFAGPIFLNFVARDHQPHTLECYLERHAEGFILLGEPVPQHDRALSQELLELNNRWALLVRENEKTLKALRQAKEATERAHTADLEQVSLAPAEDSGNAPHLYVLRQGENRRSSLGGRGGLFESQ